MRIGLRRGMLAALCGAAVLGLGGGCILGRPMAYAPGAPPVALGAQEGLAVGTLKLSNTWRTGCQPHAKSVVVKAQAGEGTSTRFQTVPFRTNAAENDQWEEFLVALPLAPGGYTFTEVVAGAQCGIVFGSGLFRVDAPFRVEPGKAVYVGRIEALRRERKRDDEPRAGGLIPLIDQAVTGFSGGTFDVRVVDAFDADVALLKSGFAPLANVQIDKALMGTVGSTAAR